MCTYIHVQGIKVLKKCIEKRRFQEEGLRQSLWHSNNPCESPTQLTIPIPFHIYFSLVLEEKSCYGTEHEMRCALWRKICTLHCVVWRENSGKLHPKWSLCVSVHYFFTTNNSRKSTTTRYHVPGYLSHVSPLYHTHTCLFSVLLYYLLVFPLFLLQAKQGRKQEWASFVEREIEWDSNRETPSEILPVFFPSHQRGLKAYRDSAMKISDKII